MTETFHAQFPVSVKPLVTSALGRRSVGLRLTLKHQPARDKKTLVARIQKKINN